MTSRDTLSNEVPATGRPRWPLGLGVACVVVVLVLGFQTAWPRTGYDATAACKAAARPLLKQQGGWIETTGTRELDRARLVTGDALTSVDHQPVLKARWECEARHGWRGWEGRLTRVDEG